MAGRIFINYRKALHKQESRLIQTELQRHFGRARVFRDESGLEAGKHWLHELEKQVDRSTAMVALIGKGWVDIGYDADDPLAKVYKLRLDNPDDFVRFEIARAFNRNIPVLPVLLDGAAMPSINDLPQNLKKLTFPQAAIWRGESFERDTEEIARALRALIAENRRRGIAEWQAAGLTAVAAAVGVTFGPLFYQSARIEPPFVTQLTDGELRAERDDLRAQLSQAEGARKKAEDRAGALDGQLGTLRGALAQAEDARAAAVTERDAARQEMRTARAGVAATEQARAAAEKRAADAEARVAALDARIKELDGEVKAAREEETAAKAEVARLTQQVADLRKAPPASGSGGQAIAQPVTRLDANRGAKPLTDAELAFVRGVTQPLPDQSFRECAECPEMVVVPRGEFLMGSPVGEGDADERPLHKQTIPAPFAVGRFEVTFAEWEACVAGGGCKHKPETAWGRGRQPVMRVSWDDITKEYLPWLNRKTSGRADGPYRLLSEAEWEYAARGLTQTRYFWGDEIGRNRANCAGCGSQWDNKQTAPVGQFAANRFGLYDMHGNVWEWTADCWNGSYASKPAELKADGAAWTTGDCAWRVLRGGSWNIIPRILRSADRVRNSTTSRFDFNGFRVARTL